MIDAVKLLEYSQELRHRYLAKLSELPWEEVVKDRSASFPSLRDIYLHCLVCVDGIVNNILQGDSSFPRINYDDYDSIEKMQEYVTQVESKADGIPQALAHFFHTCIKCFHRCLSAVTG